MQAGWGDRKNFLLAIAGPPPGLANQHGHWVGFIDQPQSAGFISLAGICWIQENTAAPKDAPAIRHQ